MAIVSFSNAQVVLTYTTPHNMNAWGLIQNQWHKVQPISTDGVNNMFMLLNAAKASGRKVTGSYDDSTGMLQSLYLL